jgi:predicted transport protein
VTSEIVDICSSCKKEPNPISSDRSAAAGVDDGGENRDNAVSYESYGDIKVNETREMMFSNHDDGVDFMVSKTLDIIQVELTSEEVIDAFIVSKETIENIKAMVESDEDKETITVHEDVCSVTSSWTLHNVQIDLTSVEGIDVCLTSISTHYDDKYKEEKNNHGDENLRMASGEIKSDAQLRSPKRVPKIFTGIKQSCGIPCETHPGVYRFEIKVHIKEEGKERFVPHSRPSPLPRRTTRRALALVEDTSPLSNPLSTAAKADPVKHVSSDNNQFNEKGDDVDNSKNVADDISESKTGRTENFTHVAKDIKESKIGHVEKSANVRQDVKESNSGRVPSSILRKSTLKKRKERQEHLYDEKSVYSTFSTDTYDSFQSLVREVEKEALLCFVKVGRYLGL